MGLIGNDFDIQVIMIPGVPLFYFADDFIACSRCGTAA